MTDTAALSVEAPPQTDWDISSAEDLKSIKYNAGRDHRFHLMNDIEITDEYWNPIGSSKQPFSGAFYGNNHTITFTKDTELIQSYGAENSGCGLFGYIYAGQICDLNIVFQGNLTSAENNTGAVVGMLDGNYSYSASTPPLLHNCKVSAKRYSITGLENTGGLVGCVVNGSIENCSSDASVISQKKNAGGSAGYVFNGTFINSSADGAVKPSGAFENFIGNWSDGHKPEVTDCFYRGEEVTLEPVPQKTNSAGFIGIAGIGLIVLISAVFLFYSRKK